MTDLLVAIKARLGGFNLDVTFNALTGVTVLFGPSGAGKSVTLAAIAGALRPDSGRIALGEHDLYDHQRRINLAPEDRAVGWVFQDARLFPHLTVEGNLRYGLVRAKGRPAHIDFEAVVSVLDIARLLGRRPRDLSGGEAQRVAIGRALLSQPRLLLMDEPLSALDMGRKDEILSFIETVRDAFPLPILYVTHALAETVRLADRLVVLDRGQVAAEGALGEVMTRADLPMLSSRADAAAVVEGVVLNHDHARQLTRIKAGQAVWTSSLLDKPVGARVRLVVLARDVMLAVEEPRGVSARNVLVCQIQSLSSRQDGVTLVRLDVGGLPILSALTPDAVEGLGLRKGLTVWALVKSVAIEGAMRGGPIALFDG